MPRTLCPDIPAEWIQLVRQVQGAVGVAPGGLGSGSEGERHRNKCSIYAYIILIDHVVMVPGTEISSRATVRRLQSLGLLWRHL